MKEVRINVTQRDIEAGVECDGFHCPVARAIGRHWPAGDVLVDGASAEIHGIYYPLPEVAQGFVTAFDLGEAVKPFSFTLRVEG